MRIDTLRPAEGDLVEVLAQAWVKPVVKATKVNGLEVVVV